MSTCNRLHLETLVCQPIMSQTFLGTLMGIMERGDILADSAVILTSFIINVLFIEMHRLFVVFFT